MSPSNTREWRKLCNLLAESFIASECKSVSDWHAPSAQHQADLEKGMLIARRSWKRRAATAVMWEGSPLGDSLYAVHNTCMRVLAELTAGETGSVKAAA